MPKPAVSFEFFPPQSLDASFRLWDTVKTLSVFDPKYVSVTYGAGGSTRAATHEAVEAIGKHYGLRVEAHLTCVDATKDETLEIIKDYRAANVRDIMALRGDPPKGASGFTPHPKGFANSVELVGALADQELTIRVGAYPERHPDAVNDQADIDWLKAKIDAGASAAITQFFFEASTFLRFRDRCEKAGITAPIIPGILPIHNWAAARRMAIRCGARVPGWLDDAFARAERDDREALFATALATEMCSELLDEGVEELHFYTINRPERTKEVCTALGLAPAQPALLEVA